MRIIRKNSSGKGLPIRTHTPNAKYAGTDGKGKVNQLRIYDSKGNAKYDIDWGHNFNEKGKSYPKGTPHYHKWKNGDRQPEHYSIPPAMKKKFYKDLKDIGEITW